MSKRKVWLESAIAEYVKNNLHCDSVDITTHFKLRADITLESVKQLEKDNIIVREHIFGVRYGYRYLGEI